MCPARGLPPCLLRPLRVLLHSYHHHIALPCFPQARAIILQGVQLLVVEQKGGLHPQMAPKRDSDRQPLLPAEFPTWAGRLRSAADAPPVPAAPSAYGGAQPSPGPHADSAAHRGPAAVHGADSGAPGDRQSLDYRAEVERMLAAAAQGHPWAVRERDAYYRTIKQKKALDDAAKDAVRVLELKAQVGTAAQAQWQRTDGMLHAVTSVSPETRALRPLPDVSSTIMWYHVVAQLSVIACLARSWRRQRRRSA